MSGFDTPLVNSLRNPSKPTFLFGCTPPAKGTSDEDAADIAQKFAERGRALAVDGYIVYDVQDESSRTEDKRPFPFRHLNGPSSYGRVLSKATKKPCVIYKAVTCMDSSQHFEMWLEKCREQDSHTAINVVGAPSSGTTQTGPSTKEASIITKEKGIAFGAVCIAERHQAKGREHLNLWRKSEWGAEWFITQGIYDPEPMSQLILDYAKLCREKKAIPKKIILTFTPCGRRKTLSFIKWLGMQVPKEAEERIFGEADAAAAAAAAEAAAPPAPPAATTNADGTPVKKKRKKRVVPPVELSCQLLCDNLRYILRRTAGCGVPLGLNVESVSGFRDEIDATHELFRLLQAILLDSSGSDWDIGWSRLNASRASRNSGNSGSEIGNSGKITAAGTSSDEAGSISITRLQLAVVALGAALFGAFEGKCRHQLTSLVGMEDGSGSTGTDASGSLIAGASNLLLSQAQLALLLLVAVAMGFAMSQCNRGGQR